MEPVYVIIALIVGFILGFISGMRT